MSEKLPLGVRLNNPGNLEWSDNSPWQGMVPRKSSRYAQSPNAQQRRFCEFESPVWGIRAIARTLITYQDKRRANDGSKIDSIREIVERWAPPSENDTQAYVRAVAKAVERDPNDETLSMHDYRTIRPVVEAIIRHENGPGPLKTTNTWYDATTIDKGLELAGVRRETPVVSKVPVTKETVGATATGGVGVAQIAEALPQVETAMSQADGHISSGSVVRIVFGVVLVVIAVVVAYSQIKKHKAGVF